MTDKKIKPLAFDYALFTVGDAAGEPVVNGRLWDDGQNVVRFSINMIEARQLRDWLNGVLGDQ